MNENSELNLNTDNTNSYSVKKLNKITIEPILYLVFFASSLSDAVTTNFLNYKACLLYLNLTIENCTNYKSHYIENEVQLITANFNMYRLLISSVFPMFLSLFIGSWSDHNGRKPFFLLSLVGYSIHYLLLALISNFPYWPMYSVLLCSIPISLTGGLISIFICSYSYITDVSTNENRAFRMIYCHCAVMTGYLFGLLLTKTLFYATINYGYIIIYTTSFFLLALAVLYGLFLLEESINVNQNNYVKFFQISHLKEMFYIFFKSRPGYARSIILCSSACLGINAFIAIGQSTILYLSLRSKLSWDLADYSYYSAIISFIKVTLPPIALWFLKKILKLHDSFTALIGSTFGIATGLLLFLTNTTLSFYIVSVLDSIINICAPTIRTEISTLIEPKELVHSLIPICLNLKIRFRNNKDAIKQWWVNFFCKVRQIVILLGLLLRAAIVVFVVFAIYLKYLKAGFQIYSSKNYALVSLAYIINSIIPSFCVSITEWYLVFKNAIHFNCITSKVFTFVSIIESMLPIASIFIYTFFYSYVLEWNPFGIFLLSALLSMIIFLLLIIINVIQNLHENYYQILVENTTINDATMNNTTIQEVSENNLGT